MSRFVRLGALAVLAALGAGLVFALVHVPAGGHVSPGGRPLTIHAQLAPRDPQFGDTVVATIEVHTGRVDPESVHVHAAFAPYEVVSRTRSVRDIGGSPVVRLVTRLRCLEVQCVPRGAEKTFRFRAAAISFAGGSRVAAWPRLRVHSRLTRAALARPVVRVPPPVAAPARYRLPPTATGIVLLVLAALLGGCGAFLLLRIGLRRARPHRQDRGRTGQWADYHGEPSRLARHRPLWLDEHAGARPERWARHWWPSHGGRHYPRLSVLISRNAQETRG